MSKQFNFKQFSLAYKNISISNNSVKHKYTVSKSKTVLFLTIQFSINRKFIFNWTIYQVLQLRARVNLGAMAMKRYSALPKAAALL